jgi:prophage regulatory protein
MITRVALATRQRALAAAVERIEADAKREGRGLSEEEIAQREALTATLATLTRDINRDIDLAASPAHADVHRGHALARGPPLSGESFLRWRQVAAKTGLSRASIWRGVRARTFPRPVRILGPNAVAWLHSEIDAWIESRVRQRDQHQPRRSPHSPGRPKAVAATTTLQDA